MIGLTALALSLVRVEDRMQSMTRSAQEERKRLTAYMLSTVSSAWCLDVPVARQDADFVVLELRTYLDSRCQSWGPYAAVDSRVLDAVDRDKAFGCLDRVRKLGFFTSARPIATRCFSA